MYIIICGLSDIVEEELNTLYNTTRENGYVDESINKYMILKVRIREIQTENKKSIFICLQFRGGAIKEMLNISYLISIQLSIFDRQ